MDEAASDDFYDDADLDGLPPNTYQELEQRARFSTQQAHAIAPGGSYVHIDPTGRGDGVDSPAQDESGPPSSDYGLDDEDVIDLDKPEEEQTVMTRVPHAVPRAKDEVKEREQWRQQRYGSSGVQRPFRPPVLQQKPAPAQVRQVASEAQINGARDFNAGRQDLSDAAQRSDVSALQARIAELEQAHTVLTKANEEAKAASYAKAGEIAIVRANQDRVTKEYESKMAALQKRQIEDSARHKSELDAARKEREKLETTSKFLEHDLAQEAQRARNVKKDPSDTRSNVNKRISKPSPLSTPQKTRHLPFRDGFDDGEVVVISPSKGKAKAGTTTPKAGDKRKRNLPQPNSPVAPLSFTESESAAEPEVEAQPQAAEEIVTLPSRPHDDTANELVDFTQSILNHLTREEKRTIEVLTTRYLPSSPSTSLASSLYDALRLTFPRVSIDDFRLRFCNTLLDVWDRCLEEKHYVSITEITDMLESILLDGSASLSVALVPRAAPLCLATSDLIAVPRAKAAKNPAAPLETPLDAETYTNPYDYLELLHLFALYSCHEGEAQITTFWSMMEHDFVLLMLAKAQPLSQISLMLRILGTSVLEGSFGAIASAVRSSTADPAALATRQTKTEYEIISRLTVLLFDVPTPPMKSLVPPSDPDIPDSSPPPNPAVGREPDLTPSRTNYTATSLLVLRSTVLSLLKQITLTAHGLSAFCAHRLALGRLVRFLHESVLELYTCKRDTHALTTAHVNMATLLLAHITITAGDQLDLRARLAAEPGGGYKHLIALGRVGFADGESAEENRREKAGERVKTDDADLSMEGGISAAASEAALRLLDEVLSPEEGEAVVKVFSSGR